jgi:hypothetical protein
MMMLQDPSIQQFIGQNPKAQQIIGGITAHIAEHVGYKMRQQIEQQLGMPLPPEDEKLPPQIEIALSGMMAQAANQVMMQNQAQAAAAQQQQQAQDPVFQLQQREIAVKEKEVELKGIKVTGDLQYNSDKIELEAQKIAGDQQLKSMQVGANIKNNELERASRDQQAGIKMGSEIGKNKAQLALQEKQALLQNTQTFNQGNKTK